MDSRDQAEKIADSLLQPSKEELAAKKEKLARRMARRARIHKFIPPAAAAAAALESIDYFNSPFYSFLFGASLGWAVAIFLDKRTP